MQGGIVMSEKTMRLEISGKIRGYQATLSLDTTEASLSGDVMLLTNLLEKSGAIGIKEEEKRILSDEPIKRLASELDVDSSDLQRLVGYKEGMVQITRASQLQVTDAMCMLLCAYEKGYGESAIAFEQFDSLIKQNGIKLAYPLTTAIFSLLNSRNYINQKLYDEEKKISLSPQGEENARSAFKDYITGKGAKRTPRIPKKPSDEKKHTGVAKRKSKIVGR
jgi:hypothetical protein